MVSAQIKEDSLLGTSVRTAGGKEVGRQDNLAIYSYPRRVLTKHPRPPADADPLVPFEGRPGRHHCCLRKPPGRRQRGESLAVKGRRRRARRSSAPTSLSPRARDRGRAGVGRDATAERCGRTEGPEAETRARRPRHAPVTDSWDRHAMPVVESG